MKIHSQYCITAAYAVTAPAGHQPAEKREFPDCLFLQVGVESDDTPTTLSDAVKEIRRIGRNTGAKRLLVNGFAGYADKKLRPDLAAARDRLADLIRRLEADGWEEVHWMPFGLNKDLLLDIPGGLWEQRIAHL